MVDDEGTAVALAKWLFASSHGYPPALVDALLADPRLALPAAGVALELERRWVPFARAVLAAVRAAGGGAPARRGPAGEPGR
jgi:hypothetical protein